MCGIAGEIVCKETLRQEDPRYRNIQAVLRRRGPDQSGIYCDGRVALIHDRLSVIDPEGGCQPMCCQDAGRSLTLVYNGELYNTEEIRRDLKQLGYAFAGHSDTEVVLKAYAAWGADCVNRFNGIFAFAVYEDVTGRLFLARDRMGVKPLFYAQFPEGLVFASELKGILASERIRPVLDREGLCEIMLLGPGRTPGCGVFQGVREVPRAHCGYWQAGRLTLEPYWVLRQEPHTESLEETAEHVRFLVTDAIRRQLVSDVPLGTFLSGGLDSSLISSVTARAFRQEGKTLQTFTVDYADNDKFFRPGKFQPNTDSDFTGLMNDYLGAEDHKVILDTPALVEALFDAVDARDLPGMADVDASLLLFCREIRKHCTVALSGECADEVFGGYPWYRDPEIRARAGFPWAQSTDYRAGFLRPELAEKIDPADYVDSRYRATCAAAHKLEGLSRQESRMQEMMLLNVDWFMQTLLDRKDRMSMYNSLEVRVPFCDYRIVEYLYSVPWEMKDHQHYEKGLLRYAMEGYLPKEVLWRKKSPYPKTHNPSYFQAVSARLREILGRPDAPIFRLVEPAALEGLFTAEKPWPWYGQLMATPQTIAYLLQLNYWLEKYRVEIRI